MLHVYVKTCIINHWLAFLQICGISIYFQSYTLAKVNKMEFVVGDFTDADYMMTD